MRRCAHDAAAAAVLRDALAAVLTRTVSTLNASAFRALAAR
jgi:hypothetical protein